MKLTLENYKDILNEFDRFNEKDASLVKLLLMDAYECSANGIFPDELEIYIKCSHTSDEYPDYYGTFSIKWADKGDTINDGLRLCDLNDHMCTLCQAFEQLSNE